MEQEDDYNYILTLPYEVQLAILINTGYPDVVNICRSNKQLSYICDDEYLWKQLVLKDFPEVFYNKGEESYKDFYITNYHYQELTYLNYPSLFELKPVDITYEEFYSDIESYIEDQTNELMNLLGINITDELLQEIIEVFRDFSSYPTDGADITETISRTITRILEIYLYISTNEEEGISGEEGISEEEFNNLQVGLNFGELLENADDIYNYVACILNFLTQYVKC